MTDSPVAVRNIRQIDAHTFGIEWTDGRQSQWRLAHLRRHCPCASCVDEWTGAVILKPGDVDENLGCAGIESVGRYAILIKFTDGHTTGLYSYDLLRKLDRAGEAPASPGPAAPAKKKD